MGINVEWKLFQDQKDMRASAVETKSQIFLKKDNPKHKSNKCERDTKRRSSKSDSEQNFNSKHDFIFYSIQHKQKFQLEGVTLLLPLTLLPTPGPGTLAAVTQLRPHQLTQLNSMQQDREQGFFLGTCLLQNTL